MKRLSILGVAAEAALPYAGLSELVRPVLWGLEALPARQSRAIRLALGAGGDGTTDALAVYAGVLALLAEVASREPLIIIVDDAHWLDIETVNALAFVARRIEDESIGVLVGARSSEPFEMPGVPQLRLGGVDLAAAMALVAGPAMTWNPRWFEHCARWSPATRSRCWSFPASWTPISERAGGRSTISSR